MGKFTNIALVALAILAAAAPVAGQDQSRIQARSSTYGVELPGTGPASSRRKTYIVQLREPSAIEHHAALVGPAAGGSLAAGNGIALRSVTPFNRDSAEIASYARQLATAQDQALARVAPGQTAT